MMAIFITVSDYGNRAIFKKKKCKLQRSVFKENKR